MSEGEIAMHEAGHAVVGWLMGRRVERVSLHDRGGETKFAPFEHRTMADVRATALIACAGDVALQRLGPVKRGGNWWRI